MDNESHEEYPDEIELGREVPDYGMDVPVGNGTTKEKTRTIYPCLYISGSDELKKIPEEGCCMIRYKRTSLTTRESGEDEPDCSIELEVHAICLKGGEEPEDGDLEEKVREFMEAQGKE